MGLKVASIIKFVRTRLRQPNEADSNFTDEPGGNKPDLISLINDVRGEVCEYVPYYRQALQYVGTGATAYPLPDGLINVEKITSLGVSLRWLTVEDSGPYSPLEPFQNQAQYGGYGALIKGNNIHFLPGLSGGETRTLHYIGIEPEILDKDATLYAPQYMLDIYGFATLKECYASLKNTYWAEYYEAKYMKRAKRVRGSEMARQFPGVTRMRRPI